MDTLKKRDILQDVLTEYGYSGWYVIEPNKLNPANCLVFNPKEKKMGEVSKGIPENMEKTMKELFETHGMKVVGPPLKF